MQLQQYFVNNSSLLLFIEILVFCHIICVIFTNYTICIISNNLFNYSIQNYSDVPLTNKNRIIPISKQLQLWMPLLTISLQNTVRTVHTVYWILAWILGVASKQLRLLHGRVGDSTIVVNSLSPQMSELAGRWCYCFLMRYWQRQLMFYLNVAHIYSLKKREFFTRCLLLGIGFNTNHRWP